MKKIDLRSPLASFLNLLLLKPMLEGDDARPLHAIQLLVVKDQDHAIGIHVLTKVELEVLELGQETFDVLVDVGLEEFDLVLLAGGLQMLDNLLHVNLDILEVILLGCKASVCEPVVENDIDSTDGSWIVGSLVSVSSISGGIGTAQDYFSFLASLVRAVNLVDDVINQLHLVGIGEQLIAGENILEDLHVVGEKEIFHFRKLSLSRGH